MNDPTGFIPRPELSCGNIRSNAFLGFPQEREFPIMNNPSAIGCEVSQKSILNEGLDNRLSSIFDEVRAIHENY